MEVKISLFFLVIGGVLLIVIFFSGFFGFYQEKSSSAIMESFKKMVPRFATVIRSGREYAIPSEEIVQGRQKPFISTNSDNDTL